MLTKRGFKMNMLRVSAIAVLCLAACVSGDPPSLTYLSDNNGGQAQTVDEIAEICETSELQTVTLEVAFPDAPPNCNWGQDGNLLMQQGVVTGRQEQVASLDLPEGEVICGLKLGFKSLDPSFQQVMVYDDNFFLTFNDVVLAASYGPMVEVFEEDNGLYTYDWNRLKGYDFGFGQVPTYCIGADEGLSTCQIPPPEQPGLISLDFGGELIERLSLIAVQQGRYDFMFVATGDNDPATDCSHAAFQFTVDVTLAVPGGS